MPVVTVVPPQRRPPHRRRAVRALLRADVAHASRRLLSLLIAGAHRAARQVRREVAALAVASPLRTVAAGLLVVSVVLVARAWTAFRPPSAGELEAMRSWLAAAAEQSGLRRGDDGARCDETTDLPGPRDLFCVDLRTDAELLQAFVPPLRDLLEVAVLPFGIAVALVGLVLGAAVLLPRRRGDVGPAALPAARVAGVGLLVPLVALPAAGVLLVGLVVVAVAAGAGTRALAVPALVGAPLLRWIAVGALAAVAGAALAVALRRALLVVGAVLWWALTVEVSLPLLHASVQALTVRSSAVAVGAGEVGQGRGALVLGVLLALALVSARAVARRRAG